MMKIAKASITRSVEAIVTKRGPILVSILAPKSIALIGASEKPDSVGRALLENLESFRGRVSSPWPSLHSLPLSWRSGSASGGTGNDRPRSSLRVAISQTQRYLIIKENEKVVIDQSDKIRDGISAREWRPPRPL